MSDSVTDTIHAHFSRYPRRTYPKGQILVFADESPEHIFYIVEGRVRKYDVSYRGDEVVVNTFKPPAFFPMSWAINRSPNHYFYKTEVATILHVIPVDDALEFIKANPDVMLDLLSRIYHGMDGLLGRMVHVMSGSARSRLLYELIIETRRFGSEQSDGVFLLSSTETDLAARTGLTRETVSREMKKLKANGWVELTASSLVVKDLAALQSALGADT